MKVKRIDLAQIQNRKVLKIKLYSCAHNRKSQSNHTAMKLFQIIQKNFAFLGIRPIQPRFNWRSVTIFHIFTLAITFSAVFLFFKANTFLEYAQNAYVTTTVFTVWIGFLSFLIQKQKLFQLIDDFEKCADEREWKFII